MADNSTLPATGDVIAADDVTSLNGAGSSGVKVQRVKSGWGSDNTYVDTAPATPFPVSLDGDKRIVSRALGTTDRIPGRAGTTGQTLMVIRPSAYNLRVNSVKIHYTGTVVKAVTVLPPDICLFMAYPAGSLGFTSTTFGTWQYGVEGAAPTVTAAQDASASGTLASPALAQTFGSNTLIVSMFAPRLITAVGPDNFQPIELIPQGALRAGGLLVPAANALVVGLTYTLATQNPATDMWRISYDVSEYVAIT